MAIERDVYATTRLDCNLFIVTIIEICDTKSKVHVIHLSRLSCSIHDLSGVNQSLAILNNYIYKKTNTIMEYNLIHPPYWTCLMSQVFHP